MENPFNLTKQQIANIELFFSQRHIKLLIEFFNQHQVKKQFRFVGGIVRDLLYGINANEIKDIDVATILLPNELIDLCIKSGVKYIATGLEHGTITIVIDKHNFEITTLRTDIECYGRKALVNFTNDWLIDASRRDFTINALYLDMDKNLYDYFSGTTDLQNGYVKFVGDPKTRVEEDYLRMIRFFRFYSYYGNISNIRNNEGFDVIKNLSYKITSLSKERITKEINKIFLSDKILEIVPNLIDCKLLSHIFSDECFSDITKLLKFSKFLNYHIIDKSNLWLIYILLLFPGNFNKPIYNKITLHLALTRKQKKLLEFIYLNKSDLRNFYQTSYDEAELKYMIRHYGKENILILFTLFFIENNQIDQNILNVIINFNFFDKLPINGYDIQKTITIDDARQIKFLLKEAEMIWIRSCGVATREEIIISISRL